LTVTADPKSKVYGEVDPSLTYVVTGTLKTGDSFSGSLTRVAGESIGAYAIGQGSVTAGSNYVITYVSDNLTITPKTLTVMADPKSKVYGEVDPALTYKVTGLLGTDTLKGKLARLSGAEVGTYPITIGTLSVTENYAITFVGDSLKITPRTLEVIADSFEKGKGEIDPAFTVSYEGFLSGDDSSDVSGLKISREKGETVGKYVITPSDGSAKNYTIKYTTGILEIISTNTAPVLDSVSDGLMRKNGTYTITSDNWYASDIDGDPLTLIIAPNENYTINGSVITAEPNFEGVLSVPVKVTDGLEFSNSKTILITVRDRFKNNRPELIGTDTLRIEKKKSASASIAIFSSDADSDMVKILVVPGTNFTVRGDTIVPDPTFVGILTPKFRLTDGIDTTQAVPFTVEVFERFVDMDYGQIVEGNMEAYRVVTGPNPVPPTATEINFEIVRGKADRVQIKVFSAVGELVHSGESVARSDDDILSYDWDISRDHAVLAGNSYVVYVQFFAQGKQIEMKRHMIGMRR